MTTTSTGVNIPNECSSQQLYQDASEVVTLSTNLAGLEDKFDRQFFQYYNNPPTNGMSDKAREMWALNQIKEHSPELWVEIDTTRARMRGLTLKASILNAASRIHNVEVGYVGSGSGGGSDSHSN